MRTKYLYLALVCLFVPIAQAEISLFLNVDAEETNMENYRIIHANGEIEQGIFKRSEYTEIKSEGRSIGKNSIYYLPAPPATHHYISIPLQDTPAEDFISAISAFSIIVWIKPEKVSSITIFERLPQKEGCFVFRMQTSGEDEYYRKAGLVFQVTNHGSVSGTGLFDMESSRWIQLAMTFDHGAIAFYVDGEPLGEETFLDISEIPAIEISNAIFSAGRGFNGELAEAVIIAGKALGAAEIHKTVANGIGVLLSGKTTP